MCLIIISASTTLEDRLSGQTVFAFDAGKVLYFAAPPADISFADNSRRHEDIWLERLPCTRFL
jgi:hypothetical protein